MNRRKYRDIVFFSLSILFSWLYLPHCATYFLSKKRREIDADLLAIKKRIYIHLPLFGYLLFFLHNNPYFRTLFYHRIGTIISLFISWYRPGCKYFTISQTTKIAGGVDLAHPYSTILNAESIGKNFSVRHLTTLGNKKDGSLDRPVILNNVTLGANVTIIGKITIGNNVVVGAGSVVTKDIPDNCIVVGNPARIISRNGIRINAKIREQ